MKNIEIKIINPDVIQDSINMMCMAAKLTQRGNTINNINDIMDLYEFVSDDATITKKLLNLPHPTLCKFTTINIVICGCSRRFLAQITRHQNEVKFMSTSMQYSNYSGYRNYVIPYHILCKPQYINEYITECNEAMNEYIRLIDLGISHDDAAYLLPHSLRTALIISATPFQWRHMIQQRICKRNSLETRYIMLKIWKELFSYSESLFGTNCLPDCCNEDKLSCNNPYNRLDTPSDILARDFSACFI